jgi:two-component system CheB/CheR fusion protein
MIEELQGSAESTPSHAGLGGDEHAPSWDTSRARQLLEATQIATIFLDRHMIIRGCTPEMTALFDLASCKRNIPLTELTHQLQGLDLEKDVAQAIAEGCMVERVASLGRGDALYLVRVLPYRMSDDNIAGAVLTFVNVTSLLMAEKQQRTLVTELNHRVRNMLQVIIGLCNQIVHRSADLKQFQAAFIGRVQALARAYELLSRDGWKNIPIADLIRAQLCGFAPSRRYTVHGEPVTLSADAALALGLAIYELATNATKYGALSNAQGQVEVSWAFEGDASRDQACSDTTRKLSIEWSERGGPPVSAPTRRGFGCELIERQLKYALNGEAKLDFADAGLKVTLLIPIKDTVDVSASAVP